MDILYIVGTGSKWDNNELRYSLRSIDKYGINVDRVFIVGEKPDFVSGEITHIPCADRYSMTKKHNNIHQKIAVAMGTGLLGDHFLISSDDHFYCKPTDFNNYPVYYRESRIPTTVPDGVKPNSYWYSLFETRSFLKHKGFPIFQTNPHANTHIDVKLWMDHIRTIVEASDLPHGGEINCIMGNIMITNGWEPKPIQDCKIYDFANREEFDNKIKDVHVFSMSDSALGCGIDKILQEMYPEKSRWEK